MPPQSFPNTGEYVSEDIIEITVVLITDTESSELYSMLEKSPPVVIVEIEQLDEQLMSVRELPA